MNILKALRGSSAAPMSTPKYVYKILPHSSVDTRYVRPSSRRLALISRYTFPVPIPASHTFFLSELDYNDGFIHMSTAKQVPKTLERFFADVPSVTLLRMDYGRLSGFKRVIWEGGDDSELSSHA
jgi:hypothetical protein